MLKNYLLVTKPGILFGNLIAVAGSFLLASKGSVDIDMLLSTVIGISLVIASACVSNNCIDRKVDRLMARTRDRVLANGLMSTCAAAVYASVLGAAGMALLFAANNLLSVTIVLTGYMIYVGLYSLYLKRNSAYAPLIGSLAGAAPPLAGYCAVSNRFDTGAVILMSIFCLWQMPHFYAIAIYRLDDYAAAAIPVLPLKQGVLAAKRHIVGYILAFTAAALMLTFAGYTGYSYLAVAFALGMVWLSLAWVAYKAPDDRLWAKKLFMYSILVIIVLSIMMSIDATTSAAPNALLSYTSQFNASRSFH